MQNSRQPNFRYKTYSLQQSKKASYRNISPSIFQLCLIFLVLSGTFLLKYAADSTSSVIESGNSALAAEIIGPFYSGPKINERQLSSDINTVIAKYPGLDISVVYQDLTRGKLYQFGSKNTFIGASIPKLLTASLFLHEVDQGKRSLNDLIGGVSAHEQLRALIEVSDNNAWIMLDKSLGSSNLEAYAKSIGMERFNHKTNSISARDITLLMQKLYSGQLLTSESTAVLLKFMKNANYRQYIVAALPAETTVYHKVGFLPDRILDTAIVDNGKHPYVMTIFTQARSGSAYLGDGNLLQSITRIVNAPYAVRNR